MIFAFLCSVCFIFGHAISKQKHVHLVCKVDISGGHANFYQSYNLVPAFKKPISIFLKRKTFNPPIEVD